MSEPEWLTRDDIISAHAHQLRMFGGPAGLRDEGMLDSALDRPKNKWAYEDAGLPELAASYAYGLAKNHPFVDGNKRIAFLALLAFLRLNGVPFAPDPAHGTAMILGLASGEIDEGGLARWIRDTWPAG